MFRAGIQEDICFWILSHPELEWGLEASPARGQEGGTHGAGKGILISLSDYAKENN